MSYSLQLYTLRDALQEDLPGTISKVADIGFTQVEPYDFVATAKELGAALKENGLTAPSGHAPLLTQNQDEIFAAARVKRTTGREAIAHYLSLGFLHRSGEGTRGAPYRYWFPRAQGIVSDGTPRAG